MLIFGLDASLLIRFVILNTRESRKAFQFSRKRRRQRGAGIVSYVMASVSSILFRTLSYKEVPLGREQIIR
jgi:hypothetical protein